MSHQFKHRFVVPCVPDLVSYAPFLKEAHQSGIFSNFGPLVRRFEEMARHRFGTEEETCVTAASATAGLSGALIASGVCGEVIIPAFTFPATLASVKAANLAPVVVDVDPKTWLLGLDELQFALDHTRPSAAILVAPFGLRRDLRVHIDLCRRQNLTVIIDNAAGFGIPRTVTCSEPAIFEVFSLHATKPFAVGEGGLIFAHKSQERRLKAALNFALSSYSCANGPSWGLNGKMSEFHGAVALAQMAHFADDLSNRRAFVRRYIERLKGLPIVFPTDDTLAPWQGLPVLFDSAAVADVFEHLTAREGLEIRRYYRPSLSRWPGANAVAPCVVAESLADRMCVLPVRATNDDKVTSEIMDIICRALNLVQERPEERQGGFDYS